ncbi:hypothetical protein SUGI_1107390 [Cryptomeria japonica]|uniref:nuclear transcription factor Y subunit B-3 n=1 Tax=Cryptomeria japonica TaxID=3369 RepID=UPI0024148E05|nr:nuclear transcription factor Y subunit B-3 [Cryptomeria japonica]GLJ52070.1 hypothetical protein SUGI_1107390 [Cryptomeria japonica]
MASSRQQRSPDSSPRSEDELGAHAYSNPDGSVKEQDRFLPIANVSRIMKKALPANAKISKDAKETVQECVSEFISFITGEASDKCQREKRKTINGDDLLWAMGTLGFENYVDPLKVYLQKYRELEGEKTSMAKQGGADHDQSPNSKDGASASGNAGNGSGSNPAASNSGGSSKYSGSYYSSYGAPQMYGGHQQHQQMLAGSYHHQMHTKTSAGNTGDHHPRGQW